MRFRTEVGESLTLKFAEAASQRRNSGEPIVSLGLGEPDFNTPPEVIDAVKHVLDEGNSVYSSPMGLPPLRENIAQKLWKDNNIACGAENILIAAGAKQAFQIACMALLEPGDEVVVLAPAFVSFVPQICLAEPDCVIRTVDVSKTDFSTPVDELKAVVTSKTKIIVVNSPNNPAGYVTSAEELNMIYALAERHDAYIISDEVYEKLNFSEVAMMSIGSLEKKPERVITINGFSKSHAMTGWRVGYACIPKTLLSKVLKIQQHMNTNTCTFIQKALASIEHLDQSYISDYREILKSRSKAVAAWAESTSGISLVKPEAGFFAFVNIGVLGLSSNEFCSQLISKVGVATTPGVAFGPNWDDHIRLSFAVSDEILNDGLYRISNFIDSLRA